MSDYVQSFARDASKTLHRPQCNPLHMENTRAPADELETVQIFRRNAAALLAAHSDTQEEIAKRAGLSRRGLQYAAGISQNKEIGGHAPNLRTMESVAAALGVELWQLLLPDFSAEAILSSQAGTTFRKYLRTSPEGRTAIDTMAAALPEIGNRKAG